MAWRQRYPRVGALTSSNAEQGSCSGRHSTALPARPPGAHLAPQLRALLHLVPHQVAASNVLQPEVVGHLAAVGGARGGRGGKMARWGQWARKQLADRHWPLSSSSSRQVSMRAAKVAQGGKPHPRAVRALAHACGREGGAGRASIRHQAGGGRQAGRQRRRRPERGQQSPHRSSCIASWLLDQCNRGPGAVPCSLNPRRHGHLATSPLGLIWRAQEHKALRASIGGGQPSRPAPALPLPSPRRNAGQAPARHCHGLQVVELRRVATEDWVCYRELGQRAGGAPTAASRAARPATLGGATKCPESQKLWTGDTERHGRGRCCCTGAVQGSPWAGHWMQLRCWRPGARSRRHQLTWPAPARRWAPGPAP